jgi:hypothetical protein
MDSQSNLDLELIAALIDGRLSGEERARAVRMLADSDDALEVFATAVRYDAAAATHDADARVIAIPAHRTRRWRVIVPVAAAAVLAIVLVPGVVRHRSTGDFATQYALALSKNPRFATGLGAGWNEHGWSVTRGAETRPSGQPAGGALDSTIAFRLGVQSVDLDVALRGADTALARRLTGQIIDLLGAVALSQSAVLSYSELAKGLASEPLPTSMARASDAEQELRNVLNSSPSYAFGGWASAANLASQLRDTSFFTSSHGTALVRSTIPAAELTPKDSALLRLIDDRVTTGLSERGFEEIHDALQATIRQRAG